MKEVMAIIRINMMNKTKKALSDAGISSFTAKDCLGRGKDLINRVNGSDIGNVYEESIQRSGNAQRLFAKRWMSIIIPDSLVSKVVDTIIRVNKNGKQGDGKIFVLPVYESIRIRTGDEGDSTLDEE
jgi:nitrogen regulatory protein PII 2